MVRWRAVRPVPAPLSLLRCLSLSPVLSTAAGNPGGAQVLSMVSSNTVERQIRSDFVLRCNISSERARADEICTSSEGRASVSPSAGGCTR